MSHNIVFVLVQMMDNDTHRTKTQLAALAGKLEVGV